MYGISTIVSDSITLSIPGPSTPAIATASSTAGKAKNTSSVRMMIMSTLPPKKPATRPSTTLITLATVTGSSAMTSDTCPPQSRRLRMSRPCPSSPNRWPGVPMGARRRSLLPTVGSYGLSTEASAAARQTRTMTSAAARASRSRLKASQKMRHSDGRRNMRAAAAGPLPARARPVRPPHARRAGVREHEDERRHQHRRLHHRQVARHDRAVDLQPDTRPGEHDLGEQGPAHQIAHLQAHDVDDGRHRVLHAVAQDDVALGQPLGP